MSPPHVVVLGGGITGLSAAFHLSRQLPSTCRITLLEKSNRAGGWIQSFPLGDGRTALEAGPRTLRGGSPALLELIEQLGLRDSLVTTSRTSPAAQSRFLYLPPLTKLPSNFLSAILDPEIRPLSVAIAKELFKSGNRPPGLTDESVDSFISRRLSPELARKFLSSMVHGIYAADTRQLSIRSTFKILWRAEELGRGSFIRGFWLALKERRKEQQSKLVQKKYQMADLVNRMRNVSTFSFQGGMATLPAALTDALQAANNVDFRVDVGCIGMDLEGEMKLLLSDGTTLPASHVVSTIPLPILDDIVSSSEKVPSQSQLPHLNANPASTVQVLNLLLPPTPKALHPPGFGFLVPRPLRGYPSSHITEDSVQSTKTNILGCIFDSSLNERHDHTREPTAMTLMMGGPFPLNPTQSQVSSKAPHTSSTTLTPSELEPYLNTLAVQLNWRGKLPQPILNAFHTHYNCIPTYTPGHLERMEELRGVLNDPNGVWKGRLRVAGAGVEGPGVGNCIESGRAAALEVVDSIVNRTM